VVDCEGNRENKEIMRHIVNLKMRQNFLKKRKVHGKVDKQKNNKEKGFYDLYVVDSKGDREK
jgi:hypothetical protein